MKKKSYTFNPAAQLPTVLNINRLKMNAFLQKNTSHMQLRSSIRQSVIRDEEGISRAEYSSEWPNVVG